MKNEETLELRWFLAVIRRRAWLIVGCTLLAILIAFVYTARIPPTFEATTTLLVLPSGQMGTNEYSTLMAGERLALTYGQMLRQPSTLQTVISRLGLPDTPETLAKRISTEPVRETQLIRVTVKDPSAERAALIANTVVDIFVDYARALQEERYHGDILSTEEKIEAQRQTIEEIQSQIRTLSEKRIANETQLARLQGVLADNQITYRTLQQDLQALELQLERMKDGVKIVEAARVQETEAGVPFGATVTLLIDQNKVSIGTDGSNIVSSDRLAATYAQMAVGTSVLESAIATLGTGESPEALAARVSAQPITGTQLLRLAVSGTDASQAERLANAIAQAFVNRMQAALEEPNSVRLADTEAEIDRLSASIAATQVEIQERTMTTLQDETELARLQGLLAAGQGDYRTLQQDYAELRLSATRAGDTLVRGERAYTPAEPVNRRGIYILLAGIVAAMLATGAAFVLEYLDDTIQTPEDASRVLGLTTIGSIGRYSKGHEKLIEVSRPSSPPAEAYRMLAANLGFTLADASLHTVIITSALDGEGKTETAANLAVAMAKTGHRVVLVDADLRRPRLHDLFGLAQSNGLAEALLLGRLDGNLHQTGINGLQVMTSGVLTSDPIQLISSSRMEQLLANLLHAADVLIIDSPPVLGIADAAILASKSDVVLLVLRANRTSRHAAKRAAETLRQATSCLMRVVLNGVPANSSSYYGYYKYQNESQQSASQPHAERASGKPKEALLP